jgi:hypothetical protein
MAYATLLTIVICQTPRARTEEVRRERERDRVMGKREEKTVETPETMIIVTCPLQSMDHAE